MGHRGTVPALALPARRPRPGAGGEDLSEGLLSIRRQPEAAERGGGDRPAPAVPLGAVDQHGPASRVLVGDPIHRLPELPVGRWGAIQDRDVGGVQAGGLFDTGAPGELPAEVQDGGDPGIRQPDPLRAEGQPPDVEAWGDRGQEGFPVIRDEM